VGLLKNDSMNKLFTVVIFLLFISCNDFDESIQGIWVSSYLQRADENKRLPIPAKKVIEFINDSVYIKGVKNFPNSNYGGIYTVKGKKLIVDDTITFNVINRSKDSLVFEDYDGTKMVYKKLSDSLKNISKKKIPLKGKSFRVDYQKLTDTVTFLNSSVLVSKHYGNLKRNWELINYKGYDFLMIDDSFDLPLIVRNIQEKEGIINFTSLYVNSEPIKMIELDSVYENK
jgi:hypothetical protein